MLCKISKEKLGKGDLGWLKSHFHFSFGDYFNSKNMNFGVLRVINDDIIEAKRGFGMHPHKDMEIVSYVVEGKLSHEDSLGNKGVIERGQVQYMSAGKGIYHSEFNNEDTILRLLQIWILPNQKGHKPEYGEFKFVWEDRINKWYHIVSDKTGDGVIKINQDVNFYCLELDEGKEISFDIKKNRQAYLLQIEGESDINHSEKLNKGDALEIISEPIILRAKTKSHNLIIEMALAK